MMVVNGEMKVFLIVLVVGTSTSQPNVFQTNGFYWTGWFDFDNPGGAGDYERVTDNPTAQNWSPCGGREKVWIHARVKGQPINSGIRTMDHLFVGPYYGLYCNNGAINGPCKDYAVKYYGNFVSTWKDVDNPSIDDERRFKHGALQTFIQYIRIKVQGSNTSYRVDQMIKLSPSYGFRCRNVDQSGGPCKDYEVRYFCGGFPKFGFKTS